MDTSRLLQLLHRVGGEFWLPLPLIAGFIWFTGNWMTPQVLSRSYDSVNKLQAGTQLKTKLSLTILTMNAEIDRRRGITTVIIKTTEPTLKRLEYEFLFTQASRVEAAIAQELVLPIAHVRKSIGYRIKN
ncbi:hypothetical protein [Chamaesiphon minutus]|uniref:Uncharacterized protein n=1 Tax=Chamaesiphon minutus (strain ATCC 27169 / PCC 6605) TaxID=1173020 RepID=K9UBY1_CHAP6|nr:hypothetical protein [Chamaesiphon minutus]AFY92622.1 hypothetical protein Cha6605_1452 [Chamaesiphon minutus PCC 6605]